MTVLSKDRSAAITHLRDVVSRMPLEPGVYRFLGEQGEVLYVGKAKALRKRVASYVRDAATLHGRTGEMLAQARDVEWVVTASESEALILEDNFIKEARPPYNLRLRDDKSYPYIEVTVKEEWPRVRFFRGKHVPGNVYFGPYASARRVRETLDVLGRVFPYRKCRGPRPGRPSGSPCLQYFIHRSLAPCDDRTTHAEYMAMIAQVLDVLRGRLGAVECGIQGEMAAAAAAREFEKAAALRDRLAAVRQLRERQTARLEGSDTFDVVGLWQDEPGANVQVFRMRDGAMVDRLAFYVENADGRDRDDVLEEFLLEYYWDGSAVPPEIVAPLQNGEGLATVLSARRGARVNIRAAQRGPKRRLLELAQRNAELAATLEENQLRRRAAPRGAALARLRDALGLERLPLRIACYDISNLGDKHPVGSMVVFEGGVPKRAHYRRFAIRQTTGQDDFAMMREVLLRRFERRHDVAAEDYDESFASLPDLIVVDGSKGQLSAAASASERRRSM
ncbi:MAG: excinuclease ABC subunit UvrC [Thermoleophilia bacterium]